MADNIDLKSVRVIKRQPARLPSIRRHFIRALAILVLIFSAIWLFGSLMSNPRDAIPTGEVELGPVPMPEVPDSSEGYLDANGPSLPDLLEGDVAPGENPTERLDALGNPRPGLSPDDLAGANRNAPIPARPITPIGNGPRTVLIDGQPLDGTTLRPPLARAPFQGLSRASPFGQIPSPSFDGRKAVSSYARPFTPSAGKQNLALIVGGLGIDQIMTRRAISELPAEVTLSFAAHTPNLQSWINQARNMGHEVLLELPMESENFNPAEPGADHALRVNKSAAQNIKNLDWLLSRGLGYFAVTNYNGDKLVRRADILAPILTHLSDAGLGFIYDGSTTAQTLPALSQSAGLPFVKAYNLIDDVQTRAATRTQLQRLEAQATAGGSPVGVGFGYGTTIDAIAAWTQTLAGKNLELAPASYALDQ